MKQTIRIIFISCIAGLALPAYAAEQPTTDAGTLDQAKAEKVFPAKPPYSPYAGRNFPTRPFFGDPAKHGERLAQDIDKLLTQLRQHGNSDLDLTSLGDTFLLEHRFEAAPITETDP